MNVMNARARGHLRATLLLLCALLLASCGDGGGVGQGAARVGGDLDDTGGDLTTRQVTTTTPSDAAARDLAVRALARVLGDDVPPRVPRVDLDRIVARAKAGAGYDSLVESTLRDYVTQAYDRIFRYRLDPATTPPAFAVRFDENVFQRLLGVVRGTGPRGTLALPDGRSVPAAAEGIWSFVAESAPVWGARHSGAANAENCVGGLGPRCKGTEGSGTPRPANTDGFDRMDGVRMNYIEMAVAVGSIMHDRSCLDPPYVVYCNGEPFPNPNDPRVQAAESAMNPPGIVPGEIEWRKAVYNIRDGRYFTYRFGPYPLDGSVDPAANDSTRSGMRAGSPADHFSDDIRLLPGRPSAGSSDQFAQWDVPYQREELGQTTVLFAPAGKSLDPVDGRYCVRGSFARTESNPFTRWGVC